MYIWYIYDLLSENIFSLANVDTSDSVVMTDIGDSTSLSQLLRMVYLRTG
ncbi:MAG: hypothetical protein ACLS9K_04065 [Lachnospira eligens]